MDVVRQTRRASGLPRTRTFRPAFYDKPWEAPRWTVFGDGVVGFRHHNREEHEVRLLKGDNDATGTP